jgi:hypothetical protein
MPPKRHWNTPKFYFYDLEKFSKDLKFKESFYESYELKQFFGFRRR